MPKTSFFKTAIISILTASIMSFCAYALALVASTSDEVSVASNVDLRRYFEKAMVLFEGGKYKEAIIVFENLIKIEKAEGGKYFTPFAEIYIEKAKSRMQEMLVVEDKKWERMKSEVMNEAERIALQEAGLIAGQRQDKDAAIIERTGQEADRIAREKQKDIFLKEEIRIGAEEENKRKERVESAEKVKDAYEKAMSCYREWNFPGAIVEFKKVKELDPQSRLASNAESFIAKAQKEIKTKEEREILAKMSAARMAKIDMEREEKIRQIEEDRKEREKERFKVVFEQRLKERILREKLERIAILMDTIRQNVSEEKFEEAVQLVNEAMAEFPESEKFKEILHYIEMQKIKVEESALKRAREITEERMLLDVAKKHILPEEKTAVLQKEKKITPIVRVPEIRKRLKIPISVDFKDVELDYVLSFLSDATGVNIVPSREIDMGEKKVTIKIRDMPLEEALKYILKAQGLIHRIEEDAVWVAAKEELDKEQVETRVYFLTQGIGRFSESSGNAVAATEGGNAGAAETAEVKTLKDILEKAVDWPKDSKLTLDDRTGALIISNIPSNLEVVENLLYNLDVTPVQVLIEARFLEVQVTDVDDLGLEWKFNSAWGFSQNNAKQNIQGLAANSGVDFSNFSRSDEGFNLTYQGILSHPQFQVVMHALQEKQDVKTLSAPRITTLNNQMATIEVVDEYIYPTRYETSLVQYDINGDGDFDDAGETEWANIPQDFVTRNVGILLHVKPSVGVDNKTVTLSMAPEVSESSSNYTYSGDVSIPQFKTRNLSTSIIIDSGETVVMGGLIKETNTNVKTKVPLLGDLPIFGGLFRKSTDSIERKNLLIFVTATVLTQNEEVVASNE